jgi:isopentenyl-diphosphate Delta-isomerase
VSVESVVLLDDHGHAIGTAPKREAHHARTPLHLAFSLYLFSGGGDLLLTRRAADKATFPGLWTNSVCGHPGPGESLPDAATRRARTELGLAVAGLRLVLPRFAYRAEMAGVVENEMCPVYAGWVPRDAALSPDPSEVGEWAWVPWREVAAGGPPGRPALSPWSLEQIEALGALGPDPATWPAGDPALLPPAARG